MGDFNKIADYAKKCYDDANCTYGDDKGSYMIHIDMVIDFLMKHLAVFKSISDCNNTISAAYTHDLMEDAKQTFNNIAKITGKESADITLSVTDVPAENRLMKHLLTMGKTVQNYKGIILKISDIYANTSYSKTNHTSMYSTYVEEYQYRKPIFRKALIWYKDDLNQEELVKIWEDLDEINNINLK